MNVEVITADAFIGSVVGDLQSRRGQKGEENSENGTAVTAMMPLLNICSTTETNSACSPEEARPSRWCSSDTTPSAVSSR